MQYVTDPTDPTLWRNLDQIREELGTGHWRTSSVFEEVGVASRHHMAPSEFWSLDEEDRAYLVAFSRVESIMQQYEAHISSKAHKGKS